MNGVMFVIIVIVMAYPAYKLMKIDDELLRMDDEDEEV